MPDGVSPSPASDLRNHEVGMRLALGCREDLQAGPPIDGGCLEGRHGSYDDGVPHLCPGQLSLYDINWLPLDRVRGAKVRARDDRSHKTERHGKGDRTQIGG